ncbi:MAG: hypothetical protein A2X49_01620 [Lentisphaerae bacterium GWF2_52_8]|nr:MAG: hypothetical protein A2X49_01620 [Lentisphaerae bacterium GWF2_52_8]
MKQTNGYKVLTDKTPKYTVKEVSEILNLSAYTIRYYENSGLIPFVDRTGGNIRMFSDYSVSWLRLVHCLRSTGLPIEGVKHYVEMCLKGDSTIPERAQLIFQQEKRLRQQLHDLREQMKIVKYKKAHYEKLLKTHSTDTCNPMTHVKSDEPNIIPDTQAPSLNN